MNTVTPAAALVLDAAHRYWLLGRELIGVTAALKAADLIDTEWFTPEATLRGTYVHEACAMLDDDALDFIDPAYAPYVDAYRHFLDDLTPTWAYIEHKVYDLARGYAGTLDRVGFLNDKWVLVDLKTGADQPWHGPQTAAYARLMPHANGLKPDRYGLYLRKDGTYRLEPFPDRNDEEVFFAALRLARFRSLHGYRTR